MPDSSFSDLPGQPPASLFSALRRILTPIVRILLARGISFPMLAQILKSVYVDVAEREFSITGQPQTDSRISLLTGIHRKDVKRLRGEAKNAFSAPATVSLGAHLVALWTSRKPYVDNRGHPLPLPRLASEGGAQSFEGLVESASKDIRSKVVLEEWLRLGVISIDESDRVRLHTDAFIPGKGFDEKAYFFGQNCHDHLASAVSNLLGERSPLLDRSVFHDGLTKTSVAELARLSEKLGMAAIHAVNRKALELKEKDEAHADASHRMNFGIYFYEERTTDTEGTP